MIKAAIRVSAGVALAAGTLLLLGEASGLFGFAGYTGLMMAAAGAVALLLMWASPKVGSILGAMALVVGTWVVWIDPIFGYRESYQTRDAVLVLGDERVHRSSVVKVLPDGPSWQVSLDPQTPCALATLESPMVKVVLSERTHWGRRVSYGPAALVDAKGRRFHCISGVGAMK